MNKIPYFSDDEQEVIDCLFEKYWETPNKKIEYVRGSEWEILLEDLSDFAEDVKCEQIKSLKIDEYDADADAWLIQNIKSVITKIEIALANGDIE